MTRRRYKMMNVTSLAWGTASRMLLLLLSKPMRRVNKRRREDERRETKMGKNRRGERKHEKEEKGRRELTFNSSLAGSALAKSTSFFPTAFWRRVNKSITMISPTPPLLLPSPTLPLPSLPSSPSLSPTNLNGHRNLHHAVQELSDLLEVGLLEPA